MTETRSSSLFPAYEVLPLGAAYKGAAADYGQTHIGASASASKTSPDKGLTVFSPDTFTSGGLLRVAEKDPARAKLIGKVYSPTEDALSKGARLPDDSKKGFEIWYEVHGKGPTKVVFIMGLNNSCFGWLNQVEYFAQRPDKYSLLVFDNRGYGNSETPSEMKGYATSQMALDAIEICDHLGWTEKRQLNITGVSMGGMISLEIAKAIPERLASLSLISTTSGRSTFGWEKPLNTSLPPLAAVSMITRLLGGKMIGIDSDEYRVKRVADTLFPPAWMEQKSEVDGANGKTNREVIYEMFLWRFAFTRRQVPQGSFGQIRAATGHRVSNAELAKIDKEVPSILIVTGDWDNLVNPNNSVHLSKHMPSAKFKTFKGAGHALQAQCPAELNADLEACWK